MKRIFSLAAVLAVSFSMLAVGLGPGVAAGQESGNATATELEETDTPAPAEESNEDQEDGAALVDEDITLTDWSYSDGSFTLTFENSGERPKRVTISEATQGEEGAQQFNIKRERLLPGETTIRLRAPPVGGEAAAGITTSDSIAEGGGVKVSTGKQGGDPFAGFGGTSGVLSGSGLAVVMAGLAAWWVLRHEETGVMRA